MEIKKFGYAVPTVISLGGYALVRSGLKDSIATRKGFTKVFAGRMFDLLDGFVARRMGWSTTFGKVADAVLDKKATQEIHDAVVAEGLMPELFDDAIVAQEVTIATAAGVTRVLHPDRTMARSRNGAYAMAGKGLNMGGYALAKVIRENHEKMSTAIRAASHAVGAVGVFHYGAQAARDYLQGIR
jgi:phosphatidylglycerophosphate synthase